MQPSDSKGLTATMTGIPSSRIHWVKSPIVTQIKVLTLDANDPTIPVGYLIIQANPGSKPTQVTSRPMPDGPKLRVFYEGREIFPRPPKGPRPMVSKAPPRDDEILLSTSQAAPDTVWERTGGFLLGGFQLLPGTHIYEVVYWHSHLNWIDVRNFIDKTDAQGKLGYPITDHAPSNRLYFKVYMPTEEEAREGKPMKFLGEVDAKTQIPQFPIARPGDFAHKTGYWRAEGGGIEALGGDHVVFVKEGESMPNLPGDVGFDPFAFQWRFVREK